MTANPHQSAYDAARGPLSEADEAAIERIVEQLEEDDAARERRDQTRTERRAS